MTLTLSRDAAEARDCRIVDGRGRDLISRDEATTRCRLQWVIRDVAWETASATSTRAQWRVSSRRELPMHVEPDGPLNGQRLAAGQEALIVSGPFFYDTGVSWYEVLSSDGTATGSVPFTDESGRPALGRGRAWPAGRALSRPPRSRPGGRQGGAATPNVVGQAALATSSRPSMSQRRERWRYVSARRYEAVSTSNRVRGPVIAG